MLLVLHFFFFLLIPQWSGVGIVSGGSSSHHAELLCHPDCSCLDTYFQCSSLPPTLPNWIHKLNISGIGEDPPLLHLLRLQELDTLYLDGNNLTGVPKSEALPPTLLHLTITKNIISELRLEELPPSLLHLDISKNLISIIQPLQINSTINITTLNLGSNQLDSLDVSVFRGLDQLQELTLQRNRLRTLPKSIFQSLTSLEKLDLSRNRLEFLDSLQFGGLRRVRELHLRRNHISSLADGAFYGLDRLQTLDLTANSIRSVEKRWLYGLKNLRLLLLAQNEVISLEEGAWEEAPGLITIDLSHNHLHTLTPTSFNPLPSLLTLSIPHNDLTRIEEGVFLPLIALQSLDMSHNQLQWPLEDQPMTFRGLHSLRSLNLASNSVRHLHPLVLLPLTQLKSLNISVNPLTWFPQQPLLHLPRLELILSNISTLVCDCNVAWLQATLLQQARLHAATQRHRNRHGHRQQQQQQAVTHSDVLCAHPQSLADIPLVEAGVSDLNCSSTLNPPQFVIEPRSQVFLLGGTGRLECAAEAGAGGVEVEWRKNHEELAGGAGAHVQTSRALGGGAAGGVGGGGRVTSILELRNVTWGASGRYQCVALTPLGAAYSSAANVTIHSAPSFVKRPSNVTVRLGSNAKLECAAAGHPAPEIAFQKDGGEDFPAALDRRFHVMPNDDSFFIMEAKLADQGTYACSATNAAGTTTAYASVVVYQPPAFTARMHDASAVEGSHTLLECLASGSPRPLVTWSKDGAPLTPAPVAGDSPEGAKYLVADNGSLLVIRNVGAADGGRYECLLSNAVGTARGTSTLTVQAAGGARAALDSSALTVTFIIIAVFCVVGTSAAWVVVIYRARQQNNHRKSTLASSARAGDAGSVQEATPLTKFLEEATSLLPNTGGGAGGGAGTTMEEVQVPGSSSSSSKDSGTGEEPPDEPPPALTPRVLTTFGNHVRTSSPLRLATSPATPSWRPVVMGTTDGVGGGFGLVEEPNVVVLVKKGGGGDKLVIREAMRVGIPMPPSSEKSERDKSEVEVEKVKVMVKDEDGRGEEEGVEVAIGTAV